VDRAIDEGVLDLQVPGLILQPLVENAVQHAVAPRPEGGQIHIRIREDAGAVSITVADDGPGLDEEIIRQVESLHGDAAVAPVELLADGATGTAGAGGGLENVRRRLLLAYRGTARFALAAGDPAGLTVEMKVPR
jgi:sensor histidine kinase YesM